jgi:hypothetical protein
MTPSSAHWMLLKLVAKPSTVGELAAAQHAAFLAGTEWAAANGQPQGDAVAEALKRYPDPSETVESLSRSAIVP